jgi:hypothetical protein
VPEDSASETADSDQQDGDQSVERTSPEVGLSLLLGGFSCLRIYSRLGLRIAFGDSATVPL